MAGTSDADRAWETFARALLSAEAEALLDRPGGPPDRLAGVTIEPAEVARIIGNPDGDPPRGGRGADGAGALDAARGAHDAFRRSLEVGGPVAAIGENAMLSAEEADVLAVALAVELDPDLARVVAWLQDDLTRPQLSLALVRRLFPHPHAGPLAFGPRSTLVRSGLANVSDQGPWAQRVIQLHPGVLWAMDGDVASDPDLAPGALTIDEAPSPESTHDLVLVTGDDRVRRTTTAVEVAAGQRFLVVDEPADRVGWAAVTREATLTGRGVVAHVRPEPGGAVATETRRAVEDNRHLVWVLASRRELVLDDLPDGVWHEVEAPSGAVDADEFAALFDVDRPEGMAVTTDQAMAMHHLYRGPEDLARSARRLAAGPLEDLANRVRPSRAWDELILAPERITQLHELVDRYRLRSKVFGEWGLGGRTSEGLVGLFAGPSGTGKTMAAELVAGSIGVDLYTIDLSSVVSKYIGETEKNLEAIFSAARAGNLVLLFDEADALFGKRAAVTDARDRYANVEVSYLLQRLERHDGVVILTTNFAKNIDDAFRRRIDTVVEFPLPAVAERRRLWESMLGGVPCAALDLDFLAEGFELSGGSIRNAVQTAAFLAAGSATEVEMGHVVRGLGRELQKLGRLRSAIDFGPYHALLEETRT